MADKFMNQRLSWHRSTNAIKSLLIDGKPLSYIIQKHTFLNCSLKINPGVLVPRNETEEYVHSLIKKIRTFGSDRADKFRILDLCTGSGCIALALGCNLRNVEIIALDKSYKCVSNSKSNMERNVDILKSNNSEINFQRFDILNDKNFGINQKFDLIISNPPYIQPIKKFKVDKNVLKFESHSALFPHRNLFNGLFLHSKILDLSKKLLKSTSICSEIPRIVLEFDGKYQIQMFKMLLKKAGFCNFKIKKDFRNIHRSLWIY